MNLHEELGNTTIGFRAWFIIAQLSRWQASNIVEVCMTSLDRHTLEGTAAGLFVQLAITTVLNPLHV